MIFDQLNSITPQILNFALDGLSARHQAIAANIANAGTEGYRPVSVSFETQLDQLRSDRLNGGEAASLSKFEFQPLISHGKMQGANEGNIDAQTVKLNQNVVQYHALIKGMQHYMTMMSTAVKEGRN